MLQALVLHQALHLVSRLVLAGAFLLSARGKLRDPRRFVQTVVAYRILPLPLARLYGRLLPWLEAALGLWLLLGAASRYAGALAGLLLLSFFAAVSLNLLRGRKQLECGCFGGRETLGPATLLRELLLLLPALHLAFVSTAPATDPLARLAAALTWRPVPLDWLALALCLAGLGAIQRLGRVLYGHVYNGRINETWNIPQSSGGWDDSEPIGQVWPDPASDSTCSSGAHVHLECSANGYHATFCCGNNMQAESDLVYIY